MPHWLNLVSLYTNKDCIGSFVGTQRRYESLTALSILIGRVVSCKDEENDGMSYFHSYFIDTNDITHLQSVMTSSIRALTELVTPLPSNNNTNSEVIVVMKDAMLVEKCIASLQAVLTPYKQY